LTRRVVVTGVGLVCALGIGTEESWKNLVAGQSGVGMITHFDTTGFDCKIAGEVKNFDPFQWIEKKELKKMGRFIQIALAGADFAVKMAGWKPEHSDLDEVGVYVSSGIGGFDIIEREHIKLMQGGPGRISPFFIPSAIVNLASFASIAGVPNKPAYTASKHAVLGLTRSAALFYAQHKIRINALCPGSVNTAMIHANFAIIPGGESTLNAANPARRMAEPAEIAEGALWLCSARSRYVVGHGLVIDGGQSVQ